MGFTTPIQSTLPDGTPVLMTADDGAFMPEFGGGYFIADFGQKGQISVGDGNSTIFAVGNQNVISTGVGSQVVVATGENNVISVGSNMNETKPTFVSVGGNANLQVAGGTNWVYATGGHSLITTGTGIDVVYAVAPDKTGSASGSEIITLGGGQQWTYTTGDHAWVYEGSGTNVNWTSGNSTIFEINAAGGTSLVSGFNSTDTLSLVNVLAGLNIGFDMSQAMSHMKFAAVTGPAGEASSQLTIMGAKGTVRLPRSRGQFVGLRTTAL